MRTPASCDVTSIGRGVSGAGRAGGCGTGGGSAGAVRVEEGTTSGALALGVVSGTCGVVEPEP